MKLLLRLTGILVIICLAPLVLLVGCQSRMIYIPRPYPTETVTNWQKSVGGKPISFTTSQGRQNAFLQGKLDSPRNLWIVCAGNASVALDWSDWLAGNGPAQDAFLLVDFPGYGNCEGTPTPAHIAESFRAAVPIAAAELGMPAPPDPSRLRFFGHSLGAAAVMICSSEFSIQRGVLLSPFTSTMDMAKEVTGLPIGFLVTHRYDNLARLAEIADRGPGKIIILHGDQDRIIPIKMSRRLAASHPEITRLITIEGSSHNTIPQQLATALESAGE
ncbi:MAG: alpha/beta hydrolase [Verrucomicrobiota bacterium JB025]|nr:alpha/beta hydrolase [Verrucomicrobiota bacterium JB025]